MPNVKNIQLIFTISIFFLLLSCASDTNNTSPSTSQKTDSNSKPERTTTNIPVGVKSDKTLDASHADKIFTLAYKQYTGDLKASDYNIFTSFETAADLGHTKAKYYLGMMYYEGRGTEKNRDTAIKLWQASCEDDGYKAACIKLKTLEN